MSGRKSKNKGYRGEKEFSDLMGGQRVPLSGAVDGEQFSNDVILPNGWKAEVKRRKEMEKTLYGWILDERENPDIVAFRADRMPWIVCMKVEKFQYLLECEKELKALKEEKGNEIRRK